MQTKISDDKVKLTIPAALFLKYLQIELASRPKDPEYGENGLFKQSTIKAKPCYLIFQAEYQLLIFKLKPISLTSFLKTDNKVKDLIDLTTKPHLVIPSPQTHIFVKSEYKLVRIELTEIKYIESMHEYIKIHLTDNNKVMIMLSMKSIEEQLPADQFRRIHRPFIVNLSEIRLNVRYRFFFIGKVYIPVSDHYKNKFQEYIDRKFSA